ncbi:hypothetical protein GCM10022393_28840 [Aquimarina addita]|uniref:Putative auto-transporter adhesin head GIN domain-containing protein n=1 Tax=Aquimarina addita TaxID=870485 RepID=A0ABP6UN19_9FLAO
MRNVLCIWVLLIFITSCNTENAPDCFQTTGNIIVSYVEVPEFTRILVNPNVELILEEGNETVVRIETGDNLLEEVNAIVNGDQLIISNTNDCNFVRDFNQTKVYVTAPDIREIRSATQFDISSDGVLGYSSLSLLSEDFNEESGNTNGTFHLEVASENITIIGNNIASFFISGEVENLDVQFFSGTGRFEGAGLTTQHVKIFHRGANKMIVNPQKSIEGEIRSTGDVIAINIPEIIEVQEFFTGELIFN